MPYTVESPSPVPFPTSLVVKNGSKILVIFSFGYADAAVLDRQHDIIANWQYFAAHRPHIGLRDRLWSRYVQHTAAGHGVARIDAQIDDHLFQLPRIGTHRAHRPAMVHFQPYGFAQQPFQQYRHLSDHIG